MADKELVKAESTQERRFIVTGSIVLVVVTLIGCAFYAWLPLRGWNHASQWGDFGSAVQPFGALLNVGAVLAALYSIALQREELRETRAEMKEQREEFERTAKAQEDLAAAQVEANRLAWFAELAQRRANLVRLYQLLASIEIAKNTPRQMADLPTMAQMFGYSMERRAKIRANEEAFRIDFLEQQVGLKQDFQAQGFEFEIDGPTRKGRTDK